MIGAAIVAEEETRFEALLEVLEEISPSLEIAGRHTIFFDGTDDGKRAYDLLVARGLQVRGVAIAPSRFVAEVAANLGGYRCVDDAKGFLAPLPLDSLPVSAETQRRLHLVGITTMGAVAQLRKKDLVAQFAEEGALLYDRVRGRDPQPLAAAPIPEPLVATLEFESPVEGSNGLLTAIQEKLKELFLVLQVQHKLCTRIRIRFLLESGRSALGYVNLASPLDDASRVESLIRNRLDGLHLPEPIVALQVTLEGLVSDHAQQLDLFEQPESDALKRVIDKLAVGRTPVSLMKVVWRDPNHRIPERKAYLQDLVRKPFTRALCLPTPVRVVTGERGDPVLVRMESGWQPVATLLQAWELDEEWWTSRPIMRAYYRVALENGVLLRLFQDLEEGGWFRQQV